MNVKMLQQAWKEYFSVALYQDNRIRFGQYVFNEYNYEAGNSYNEADCNKAYEILFNSLTISLDEVFDESF